MQITVLKSKLKKVVITDANVNYRGSLTLDPDIMDAADIAEWERVEVNSVHGEGRIATYVIKGERGSGQVEVNGGAAKFFKIGEEVHVNCFCNILAGSGWDATVVHTNERNQVVKVE